MNGHSVGRCFKVHGNQPGFKFKDSKIVAAVSVNCENGNEKEASHICQSQYNQFLEMYNKHTSEAGSDAKTNDTSRKYLPIYKYNIE